MPCGWEGNLGLASHWPCVADFKTNKYRRLGSVKAVPVNSRYGSATVEIAMVGWGVVWKAWSKAGRRENFLSFLSSPQTHSTR